jgi:uncharacterized membrane protein
MSSKLKSRKFWMAVVTAILVVANEGLGLKLPTDAVMAVAGIAITYILGESYVDANRRL